MAAYQPSGLFKSLTLSQVAAIQARAVEMLSAGQVIMSGSVAGQNFTGQLTMPVNEVLAECNYALQFLTGSGLVRRVRSDFSNRRGERFEY